MNTLSNIIGNNALFHFVSYNAHSLEIFINKHIYFSSLSSQNDPFDGSFTISKIDGEEENVNKFIREQYNKLNPGAVFSSNPAIKSYNDELLSNIKFRKRIIQNYIVNLLKEETGMFCFSKNPDNITMWSHYAQNGKGFCIVFDKAKLKTSLIHGIDSGYILWPNEVHYSAIPEIRVFCYGLGLSFKPETILYNKIGYWKQEDEYRLIMQGIVDEKDRYHKIKLNCIRGIIVLYDVVPFEVSNTLKNILLLRCQELPKDFYWINASLDEVNGEGLVFKEDQRFKKVFKRCFVTD